MYHRVSCRCHYMYCVMILIFTVRHLFCSYRYGTVHVYIYIYMCMTHVVLCMCICVCVLCARCVGLEQVGPQDVQVISSNSCCFTVGCLQTWSETNQANNETWYVDSGWVIKLFCSSCFFLCLKRYRVDGDHGTGMACP